MAESLDDIVLNEKKNGTKDAKYSFSKGMSFTCKDEDNIIQYQGSLTGKESVFLNGELVSEKRNFKMSSSHNFSDKNGTKYSIQLKMIDLRKASSQITIKREEITLKTFITKVIKAKNFTKQRLIIYFALVFISSIILSVVLRIYNLSEIFFVPYFVIILIIILSQYKKGEVIIEER